MEKVVDDESCDELYPVGRVVFSKRGKDAGRAYVVIGQRGPRLLLADGLRFNVSHPKVKNPKHLRTAGLFFQEFAFAAREGRKIDRGRFIRLLKEAMPPTG